MRRFAALGAAAALAVFTGGASLAGLYQTVDRDPVIGYPSLQEVTNFDVMARSYDRRREQGDNPRLVFGSSELNPGPAGPAHPASLLEGGDYGVDVMVTGRAFCEDLWQAIEVGAFAGRMTRTIRRAGWCLSPACSGSCATETPSVTLPRRFPRAPMTPLWRTRPFRTSSRTR